MSSHFSTEHVVTCDANRLTDIREHAVGQTLARQRRGRSSPICASSISPTKTPRGISHRMAPPLPRSPFENERRRHRLSLPGSSRKPLAPEEHVGGYTLRKHHPYPNRRIGSIPVRQCVLSISQHMNRPRYLKREKRAWPWLGTRHQYRQLGRGPPVRKVGSKVPRSTCLASAGGEALGRRGFRGKAPAARATLERKTRRVHNTLRGWVQAIRQTIKILLTQKLAARFALPYMVIGFAWWPCSRASLFAAPSKSLHNRSVMDFDTKERFHGRTLDDHSRPDCCNGTRR